jgi:endonuclease YncB( thermonuclease family)
MIPFLSWSWRRSANWTSCLAALLVATAGFSATTEPAPKKRAPAKKPKTWETFEKCTYVENASNDGDSFQVRHGKRTLHVRLYFVDAPETNLADPERVLEQGHHFGITQAATLQAGKKAAEVTRQALSQPFTVHTRWTVAGGRSRQSRFYCIVAPSGRDLGELLVGQGLARTKGAVATTPGGEPSKSVMARLRQLEAEARHRRLGAWSTTNTP